MQNKPFYTPKDIARRLQLQATTVYRLIREEIPFYRIGRSIRVKPEDFEAWLSQHQHGIPIELDFEVMERDIQQQEERDKEIP